MSDSESALVACAPIRRARREGSGSARQREDVSAESEEIEPESIKVTAQRRDSLRSRRSPSRSRRRSRSQADVPAASWPRCCSSINVNSQKIKKEKKT